MLSSSVRRDAGGLPRNTVLSGKHFVTGKLSFASVIQMRLRLASFSVPGVREN